MKNIKYDLFERFLVDTAFTPVDHHGGFSPEGTLYTLLPQYGAGIIGSMGRTIFSPLPFRFYV